MFLALEADTDNDTGREAVRENELMPDGDKVLLVQSNRTPGATWDLHRSTSAAEVYVDGVGAMLSGPAVTRLDFFSVIGVRAEKGVAEPIEDRVVNLRLVIPTSSLIEMAGNILNNYRDNQHQFDIAHQQTAARLLAITAGLKG